METPRSPIVILTEYIRQHGEIYAIRAPIAVRAYGGQYYQVSWGRVRISAAGRVVIASFRDETYTIDEQAWAVYYQALADGAVPFGYYGVQSEEYCLEVIRLVAPELYPEACAGYEIAHILRRLAQVDGEGKEEE